MNLAGLDMNLLVTLDALLSEAHVGRAASRIGLSQPAASHALRRLRDLVGDPLLVRAGARMELTPRARAMRIPLSQTLDQVRGLLLADSFDPSSSVRNFAIMMPDLVVDLLMPLLVKRVGERAPNVRLTVTPWRSPAVVSQELTQSIDLVVSCTPGAFVGFQQQRLYSDRDAIAVRSGHPIGARLSRLDAFLEVRHVAVVSDGRSEDMIDHWLREKGIERRIALVVPTYLQALHITARTDLVAFVPRRLISISGGLIGGIRTVEPPLDPGVDNQYMFYPKQSEADPGSIWLRNIVTEIGRTLDRTMKPARARPAVLSR